MARIQIALTAIMVVCVAMSYTRWPAWILCVVTLNVALSLRDCLRDLRLPAEREHKGPR